MEDIKGIERRIVRRCTLILVAMVAVVAALLLLGCKTKQKSHVEYSASADSTATEVVESGMSVSAENFGAESWASWGGLSADSVMVAKTDTSGRTTTVYVWGLGASRWDTGASATASAATRRDTIYAERMVASAKESEGERDAERSADTTSWPKVLAAIALFLLMGWAVGRKAF